MNMTTKPVTNLAPSGPPADLLAQLRDIHLPADPGMWPPAPGWWVVAALLAALLGVVVLRVVRRWHHARFERRVLAELTALETRATGAELAAEVSALLKRVALRRFPRREVAPLTGLAWLAFLDRTGGDGRFSDGPGRVLSFAPFAPRPEVDGPALIDLGRTWIRSNL